MNWKSIKNGIKVFIKDQFLETKSDGGRGEKYSSTKSINWLFVLFTLGHIGVSLKIMYINKTIDHVLLAELLGFIAAFSGIKAYTSVMNGSKNKKEPKKELLTG
jgi:hypothetical protein